MKKGHLFPFVPSVIYAHGFTDITAVFEGVGQSNFRGDGCDCPFNYGSAHQR